MRGFLNIHTFDLSSGYTCLRILTGLFLVPHAWGKAAAPAGPLHFFTAAGFPRPAVFMRIAFGIETIAAIALVLGIWPKLAAWLAAAFLLVASGATLRVSKGCWFWMVGGCEYPLFLALCCFIVASHAGE